MKKRIEIYHVEGSKSYYKRFDNKNRLIEISNHFESRLKCWDAAKKVAGALKDIEIVIKADWDDKK